MVGPRGILPWILRSSLVMSLLGALWIAAPTPTFARPYNIDPGPGESGDPTADDQPSPTPKPKAGAVRLTITSRAITSRAIASQGTSHDATLGRGRTVTVRVSWDVYLRLLTRYWVR
ncbi:MAG: hypothetical protein AABZ94_04445 [Candidatus Eisenbacteria bacterium]